MQSADPTKSVIYRPPALFRAVAIFGILGFLFFGFVGWMAYWVDGAIFGLYFIPISLAAVLYFAFYHHINNWTLTLEREGLRLQRPWREKWLSYKAVTEVRPRGHWLYIYSHDGLWRLYGRPDMQAALWADLKARAPALEAAHGRALSRSLPITIKRKNGEAIFFAILFTLLSVFSVWAVYFALFVDDETNWLIPIVCSFGGIISIASTAVFLKGFVRYYKFDYAKITLHHLYGRKTHPTDNIQAINIKQRHAWVRGQERTYHFLQIAFRDGRTLDIEPNRFNDALGFHEGYEVQFLEDLREQLSRHYLAKDAYPKLE